MNFRTRAKVFYKGIIFSLSAGNNIFFALFYRYIYKPGKGTLDEFTSIYSKKRRSVTFVEVGANDGINNDPIHKFIKRDHWKGILLEPQKLVFEKYLKPLYSKSDNILVLNAALDFNDGEKTLYRIGVSESRWATGLASFDRKVVENAVKSGYVEKEARKEGILLPGRWLEFITSEQVDCISVATLTARHGLARIDWLQIDTEGFDFEVIKMFISEEIRPEVIVYENLHLSSARQEECTRFLCSQDYFCRTFGPNTLAMRKPATGFEHWFSHDQQSQPWRS